jgi:uncharacterized protein (TIGR03000 family)
MLMALSGSGEIIDGRCGGGRCGGGHHGRRHGGCGGGGCGGGGCGGGGCGGGGCGYAGGGAGGMCAVGGGCPGGMCAIGGTGMAVVDASQAPATLVVSLPADATLTVDDAPTASSSDTRLFVSPDLPMGREFHYTLKAKVMRDGKPVVVEETVAVKAGQQTSVTLKLPATSVAAR